MISETSHREKSVDSLEDTDLACSNAAYVEGMLSKYLDNPNEVPEKWREYFDRQASEGGVTAEQLKSQRPSFEARSIFSTSGQGAVGSQGGSAAGVMLQSVQYKADQLVNAYRMRGHFNAKLDPLSLPRKRSTNLSLESFGLSKGDLRQRVYYNTGDNVEQITLGDLINRLDDLYCNHVGYQFAHIEEEEVLKWVTDRIERQSHIRELPNSLQRQILKRLTEATVFEEFVRKKYVGAKTFSLFGSEMLIPMLDLLIERAAADTVREIVIGMPHRGRLNVLTNIIGQPARELFAQFNDVDFHQFIGGGDVKYHLGNSVDKVTSSGHEVHISLCFNPSHLEYINPVALGRLRAKQDRTGDSHRRKGMAVLIHGDAAFIGEGVVQETLNLSQLDGYAVGGTVHVIVNNQIGFTTSTDQSRSTKYCTDVARMLQIPVFHVNGDDPEAVADVVAMGMDFRAKFQRDVIIDLVCYRRLGHNEADEPSFTQPKMYQAIDKQPPIKKRYLDRLLDQERITVEEANKFSDDYQSFLKAEYDIAQEMKERSLRAPEGVWQEFDGGLEPTPTVDETGDPADECPETRITVENSAAILRSLAKVPEDFRRNRKLKRIADQRLEMAEGEKLLDWASAEALAFATLSMEGHRIRLSGQDSQRGTFNQRHSVLHDIDDGHEYNIFSQLSPNQAPVEIVNSPLSEAGVLGFDFGYSLDYPTALVCWEAQFGDFSNAAQVIIDQFISSAEDKWRRLSGLVLLLPHGYEGQGPEHSSARLERFLWLSAEDNIQVVIPTTPSQYFHVLRRQMKRSWKKPLIIMTPKSLLRHSAAVSSLEHLANNKFERIIKDSRENPATTSRIIMCSGKVYYDLVDYRNQNDRQDVAIIRVEQPYPLKDSTVHHVIDHYPDVPLYWVQEEPKNMGVWPYWKLRYGDLMYERFPLSVIARDFSSSPATGSKAAHEFEQQDLLERAFNES